MSFNATVRKILSLFKITGLVFSVFFSSCMAANANYVETVLGQVYSRIDHGSLARAGLGTPGKVVGIEGGGFLIVDTKYHGVRVFKNGYLDNYAGTATASYQDVYRLDARFNTPFGIVKDS